MRKLILLATVASLSACSMLPYEDKYACRLSDNYGRCISIKEAYEGAVAGTHGSASGEHLNLRPGKSISPDTKPERKKRRDVDTGSTITAEQIYTDDYYRELSSMIQDPKTPMVADAKEMRMLVLSYSPNGNHQDLYMPRYIYSIVQQPKFILQKYLPQPAKETTILHPTE